MTAAVFDFADIAARLSNGFREPVKADIPQHQVGDVVQSYVTGEAWGNLVAGLPVEASNPLNQYASNPGALQQALNNAMCGSNSGYWGGINGDRYAAQALNQYQSGLK